VGCSTGRPRERASATPSGRRLQHRLGADVHGHAGDGGAPQLAAGPRRALAGRGRRHRSPRGPGPRSAPRSLPRRRPRDAVLAGSPRPDSQTAGQRHCPPPGGNHSRLPPSQHHDPSHPAPHRPPLPIVAVLGGLAFTIALSGCSGGSGSSADSTASHRGRSRGPGPRRRGGATPWACWTRTSRATAVRDGAVRDLEGHRGPAVPRRGRGALRRTPDRGPYGGEVSDEQTDTDKDGEVVSAHLVLRVPSADFGRR
jgi:hypothetical protein